MQAKTAVLAALAAFLAVAAAATSVVTADDGPSGPPAFRAVVHVNFADAERQAKGLKNVRNMLKAVGPDAAIEVVCHGPGINLLLKENNPSADEVRALAGRGVKFLACENTMVEKSIDRSSLLAEAGTIPSGAVEVVRQQQTGAGYFRP